MQVIKDIEQGTPEWHEMRLGVVTASRFSDVLAKGKGLTRAKYMRELAAELITGQRAESFTNSAMEWGTENEPKARAMYEFENSVSCEQVAFIKHDTIQAGVSPDGLISDDGLVEFKCPQTTTQIETFLGKKIPKSYFDQMQGQLWISERKWCDFVSYDPRIIGDASYFCQRIERDEPYIRDLEMSVRVFIEELNDMVKKLVGNQSKAA